MKSHILSFVVSVVLFSSMQVHASTGFATTGNYVYKNKSEQIVLSFPKQGVVFYRRFIGGFEKTGEQYKKLPSASTWAPYVSSGNDSAKALICEFSNPTRKCSTVKVETGSDADSVVWSGKVFKKTDKKFQSSRFDQGPYTFKELEKIYRSRMPMISKR